VPGAIGELLAALRVTQVGRFADNVLITCGAKPASGQEHHLLQACGAAAAVDDVEKLTETSQENRPLQKRPST
jgi:hypothetical protein